jgi:hypothetical protein
MICQMAFTIFSFYLVISGTSDKSHTSDSCSEVASNELPQTMDRRSFHAGYAQCSWNPDLTVDMYAKLFTHSLLTWIAYHC